MSCLFTFCYTNMCLVDLLFGRGNVSIGFVLETIKKYATQSMIAFQYVSEQDSEQASEGAREMENLQGGREFWEQGRLGMKVYEGDILQQFLTALLIVSLKSPHSHLYNFILC